MQLPGHKKAIVDRSKIVKYLLSPAHPVGKSKAAWFSALGYTQHSATALENDLLELAALEATVLEKTIYGQKYGIIGTITGPNGKSGNLVTVWIVLKNEDVPKLVTAYPGDKYGN